MLYVSLILTAILVLAAHWSARAYPKRVRFEIYAFVTLVVFVMGCGVIGSLPVAVVGIGLFAGLLVWNVQRQRMRRFWPISLFVVVLAYAMGFGIALPRLWQMKNLQQQYPFESLAERVPLPPSRNQNTLTTHSSKQLEAIDRELRLSRSDYRRSALRSVHEEVVLHFVNSPGFGVSRATSRSFTSHISSKEALPIEQSLTGFSPEPPPKGEMPFVGALDDFRSMHLAATVDFVNPDGFGYIKDREHVAGFQSHAFRKKPEMKDFEVQSVELMSLLLHPESAVYVANQLPAMEQLKSVPTRSLDKFEANGLEAIRKGEDLHVAHYGDRLRMVGAIRNSAECIKCHGGQRGDLLGAFVYSLQEGKKKQ